MRIGLFRTGIGFGVGWNCASLALSASFDLMTFRTISASAAVSVMIDTQSIDLHAGKTPSVLTSPGVGLVPTILLNAAGILPEPAVSVPKPKHTNPLATTEAEPELDPPLTYAGSNVLGTAPYGDLVPTRPVAN